jgi:ABC-type glycerol-3-phosphate transport system substrate-binding protein
MEKAPLFAYELDKVSDDIREQVDALVEADPNRGALLEQLTRANLENITAERYAQAARWEAQKQYIVAAINGDISIDEALAAIDAAVDEALEVASY